MTEINIRDKFISKIKVTGIHLVISLVIFLMVLYLILFVWYPEPFFTAEGGWSGIRLMFLVDMVLGPSLTFIVYNANKSSKEKILDFSVIGLVQLIALVWGGNMVQSQRPLAVVFWRDAFYTVTADYLDKQNIKHEKLLAISKSSPAWLVVEEPKSLQATKEVAALIEQNIPPYAQIQLLHPLKSSMDYLKRSSSSPDQIRRCDESLSNELMKNEYHYLYLMVAKYKRFLLLMDQQLGLISMIEIPLTSKCVSR